MKTVKFKFIGDDWILYLVPKEEMEHLTRDDYGDTPIAYVQPADREMFVLDEGDLTLRTLMHELWHVAFSSQLVDTAKLEASQMEEVSAEVFAVHGPRMMTFGIALLETLRRLRDSDQVDEEGNLGEI